MSDPEQNRITSYKKFLVSKRARVACHLSRHTVRVPGPAVAFGESNRAENRHLARGTNAFIARMGGVRISVKPGCQHSLASSFSEVYGRRLPSRCRCFV